ncbi:hypothetical protein TNCV_1763711 [Trichonephila clavipes]|nr:hypothetical protein TNCV_1763711 [Trichonephila clavipes]
MTMSGSSFNPTPRDHEVNSGVRNFEENALKMGLSPALQFRMKVTVNETKSSQDRVWKFDEDGSNSQLTPSSLSHDSVHG